jgi:D-arabinose 1-dehydrogenase-like Zn-dependent alcohol dehydrogenase
VLSLFSTQTLTFLTATVNAPDLLVLKELAESGRIKPIVSRTYRLEEAVEALKELEKGHARGKSAVVIA